MCVVDWKKTFRFNKQSYITQTGEKVNKRMQYPNINFLTTLLWNRYVLFNFSSLLWEEISIYSPGRSGGMFTVIFFVTVSKSAVVESQNVALSPMGLLPGHKAGRQKKSKEQKSFKEFSVVSFSNLKHQLC